MQTLTQRRGRCKVTVRTQSFMQSFMWFRSVDLTCEQSAQSYGDRQQVPGQRRQEDGSLLATAGGWLRLRLRL
jgi:hypothetical protein